MEENSSWYQLLKMDWLTTFTMHIDSLRSLNHVTCNASLTGANQTRSIQGIPLAYLITRNYTILKKKIFCTGVSFLTPITFITVWSSWFRFAFSNIIVSKPRSSSQPYYYVWKKNIWLTAFLMFNVEQKKKSHTRMFKVQSCKFLNSS